MNAERVRRFRADGFVRIPGLAGDAAGRLSGWVDEVESWPESSGRWIHHGEETPSGRRLARTENFLPFHEGLRGLLTRGPVIEAVAQALGEAAVVLKEKINYKHSGGGGYAAHQDAPAYDYATRHVTCALAVDPASEENGCLWFAAGLHAEGLLPTDDRGCLPPSYADGLSWTPCELGAGDGVLFSSFAPHFSGANHSPAPRRSLYVTYNAKREGDFRERYYADKLSAIADHEKPRGLSKIAHFRGRLASR